MKGKIIVLGMLLSVMMWAGSLFAEPIGMALAVQVGSPGFGISVAKQIIPDLNARVGANFFSYGHEYEETENDILADGTLDLQSFSILVDWYGIGAGWFLSGGLYINNNQLSALVTSTKSYEYGGREYTPEELGEMNMEIAFNKVAPYLGLGWGNPVKEEGGLGFVFNLGAMYTNSPKVTMKGTGMITPTAEQAPDVEEDLSGLKLYGVLTFGLSYGF